MQTLYRCTSFILSLLMQVPLVWRKKPGAQVAQVVAESHEMQLGVQTVGIKTHFNETVHIRAQKYSST